MLKKLRKIVSILFSLVFLSLIVYSIYNLIMWKLNVDKSNELKENLSYKITEDDDGYKVDFDGLKKLNSDAVAYLKVGGTSIEYVVVQGNDNSYYLKHDFNKDYNRTGWIFADYRNNLDGTDKNMIIYGHNTKDGSMFGSLKTVLTSEWQKNDENHIIELVTEEGQDSYQVFATYVVEAEDYYITTDFSSDDDYQEFLDTMISRSSYDYDVDVDTDDYILTLSTCSASGKERVVLQAKKI